MQVQVQVQVHLWVQVPGEKLNHPHGEGNVLAREGSEETHQDREEIHQVVPISHPIVGIRLHRTVWLSYSGMLGTGMTGMVVIL